MGYADNKAAKRENPASDRVKPAAALASDSNQIKTLGQSAKFSTPSFAPRAGVEVGNQVRVSGNSKGTGVFGRPSSIALAGKDKTLPAVENPSK